MKGEFGKKGGKAGGKNGECNSGGGGKGDGGGKGGKDGGGKGKKGRVCNDCGAKDHIAAECPQRKARIVGGGPERLPKGGGKGKVKCKTEGKDYNKKGCLCCGKEGHVKSSCRFKDGNCDTCGKVGHLKAVCRSARGTHQVDEEGEDDAKSIHAVWAMTVTETNLDTTNYQVSHTPYGGSEDNESMSAHLMSVMSQVVK